MSRGWRATPNNPTPEHASSFFSVNNHPSIQIGENLHEVKGLGGPYRMSSYFIHCSLGIMRTVCPLFNKTYKNPSQLRKKYHSRITLMRFLRLSEPLIRIFPQQTADDLIFLKRADVPRGLKTERQSCPALFPNSSFLLFFVYFIQTNRNVIEINIWAAFRVFDSQWRWVNISAYDRYFLPHPHPSPSFRDFMLPNVN